MVFQILYESLCCVHEVAIYVPGTTQHDAIEGPYGGAGDKQGHDDRHATEHALPQRLKQPWYTSTHYRPPFHACSSLLICPSTDPCHIHPSDRQQ